MRPILNSKVLSIVLSILILWLIIFSAQLVVQKNSVDKEVENLRWKIDEAQKNSNYLDKLLAYFQSPAFLEKEARLKFNYKASGEKVVFVYKDKTAKSVSGSADFQEVLKTLPNYKKWFYYLLGY